MRTAFNQLILFLVVVFLVSCSGNKEKPSASGSMHDPAGKVVVAERIVYDVEIINPDPEDIWTTDCLKDLDREAVVDFLFEGIYSKKFKTYDIFEGNSISASRIRKMEENGEFTRDQIGKFQFQEEWILDTLNMTYIKRVTEVRMGIQSITEFGVNYNPLFKVVLPQ